MIYIYLILEKKYFMDVNENKCDNETIDLFKFESNKLQENVNQTLKNFENLSISQIIETYYQIINVSSLAKFLRQNFEEEENKSLLSSIQEIEKYIFEKFNEELHPLIMSKLKNLIDNSTKNLKEITTNQGVKTKGGVENQAKMYENLRQILSTKEFVDQYNASLKSNLKD